MRQQTALLGSCNTLPSISESSQGKKKAKRRRHSGQAGNHREHDGSRTAMVIRAATSYSDASCRSYTIYIYIVFALNFKCLAPTFSAYDPGRLLLHGLFLRRCHFLQSASQNASIHSGSFQNDPVGYTHTHITCNYERYST